MKGVILAGGTGSASGPDYAGDQQATATRLYDKPMIFYPIETLVNAGVTEILIVTSGSSAGDFLRLLGNGEALGVLST